MTRSIHSLTLYRGWPDQGKHVWSPFVVKLEARLRFAGVPYTTAAGSPRTAPKGKIPYVEYVEYQPQQQLQQLQLQLQQPQQPQKPPGGTTAPDAVQMGDSGLIAKHFVEEGVLPDLNGGLSPEDKARDLATRALLEDKLYFYHVSTMYSDSNL